MKTRRTWRRQGGQGATRRRVRLGRVLSAAAGALRGRAGWIAASAGVIVFGLVAVWLFVGGGQDGPPDPRARQYKDFDACLLTGEKGIAAGTPAAPVWEGMQEASLETRVRVSYVPVVGPQSADNARPFLNSLVQRRCDVVLAVGEAQVDAVRSGAAQHPGIRFVAVDGASGPSDHSSPSSQSSPSGPSGPSGPSSQSSSSGPSGPSGADAENVGGDGGIVLVKSGTGVADSVAEEIRRAVKAAEG
ncbi:type 1 periplasmic-binding domain-containing protein [Streptomyces spongiicola]|uniref:BMP family ABC transporter substrate-binding protein n=1 Tax=Streptomyces spongiicola TaxID=1690221 RepID=UPI0013A54221|nr:BMP family ABC transporter substrate-binding protein [Streptomyces spongiicola]